MSSLRFALGAAVLGFAGCAHQTVALDPIDLWDLGNRLFRLGCSTQVTIREKKVSNLHEPSVTDTINVVSCDGLELSTYVSTRASDPTGLPIYLEIRKPNATLPEYMNIGESTQTLISALGVPFKQDDRSIQYVLSESEDTVLFKTRDGQITSIRWDWYLD